MAGPAWSWSVIEVFRTCPRKYQAEKITKEVRFVESEATRWGKRVHKALEERVRDGKPLEAELQYLEPMAAKLASMEGQRLCEHQMTINAAGAPTGWFDKDAWCRGVADFLGISPCGTKALAIDYKTGKRKKDSQQLALFALLVFHLFPDVQRVKTQFVWLKSKETDDETFYREQIADLWAEFMPDVNQLTAAVAANNFPMKPNGLCRKYCEVTACPHNGRGT